MDSGSSSAHFSWARNLDFVLSDRPALDAFNKWLDDNSEPQYLKLYFAIRSYERMVVEKNPERFKLARVIYKTFISVRSGNCDAIPDNDRNRVGERIRECTANGIEFDGRIFSSCFTYAEDMLRRQHEKFVCSDEFIEAFNRISIAEQNFNTIERRKSSGWRRSAAQNATQLTAETLLKSKKDRHNALGEIEFEKMYPSRHHPYVCNATTSHNDSAVSSSFSGDTPSSHRNTRLRHVRDEQARENGHTFTLPRVDKEHRSESQQFDHSSEIGRRQFIHEMTQKLQRLVKKQQLNDETEKNLEDIEQCKYTTIDMVNGTEADEDMERIDEDDELDDYLRRKMKDDSQRASATRSPHVNNGSGQSSHQNSSNSSGNPPPQPPPIPSHPPPNFATLFKSTSTSQPRFHQIDRMSQSMIYTPSTSSAFSRSSAGADRFCLDAFAPPPGNFSSKSHDGSQTYDSSGFGSMAPSAFSASSDSSRDRRHQRNHRMIQSTTTPRRHRHNRVANMSNLITISYLGTDKVPVVAHVPDKGSMNLAEFKKHFALSRHGESQLFFKTDCEDGAAPFQLLLIRDEDQQLPIFEGRITAEMR